MSEDDVYRGWRRPGARPPGGVAIDEGESLDFLCGHWRIFQYQKGHRYSVDDVLCAHYAVQCAPRVTRHLDLGSGIGSVALCVAWRLPFIETTSVEAQEVSFRLLQKNIAYNGLSERMVGLLGDLRDDATIAAAAERGPFDLITGSPPYWPVGHALPSAHAQAVPARLEVRGDVGDYAATAARLLAPGGVFVCVHQASQHARVLEKLQTHLTVVRTCPVAFKDGIDPAVSGIQLYCCYRKADVPESMQHGPAVDAPLVVRDAAGRTPLHYAAVRMSFGFPPGNMAAG